jgi:hypothetical protein
VIPAAGLTLPLTKSFRFIKSITSDLEDDGNGAARLYVNKATQFVQAFNSSDVAVQARADLRIKGAKAP